MTERTREELADALDETWHMCADDRCLADRHEAARRLREMPDGERIEGDREAVREILTAAKEGLYDPMPDAITVEGALSQILVLTDLILNPQEGTDD